MVVKDRLLELHQLADLEEGKPAEHRRGSVIRPKEKGSIDEFMSEIDQIRHILMTLSVEREEIRRQQLDSLASGASDAAKSRRLSEHVDRFIRQAAAARNRIADTIQKYLDDAPPPENAFGAARARHEQIRMLKLSFEEVMIRFNEDQEHYKEQAARKIAIYLRKQNIHVSDEQIDEAIESGSLFQLTRNVTLGVTQKKALFDDVKSRANEILNVERQIREINDLFRDMQLMVASQGDTIERIETSVSNATEYAAKANRNVKEAVVLHRRSRKWKWISIVALVILVLVLLAVLKVFSPI